MLLWMIRLMIADLISGVSEFDIITVFFGSAVILMPACSKNSFASVIIFFPSSYESLVAQMSSMKASEVTFSSDIGELD